MKHYLTEKNFPVKTNCPQNDYTEISESKYKKICKERNNKIEADRIKLEEEMKPVQERRKLIQKKAMKIAEQQLIDEGILEPGSITPS